MFCVYLFIYLFIFLFISLFICLLVCLFVCLFGRSFVFLIFCFCFFAWFLWMVLFLLLFQICGSRLDWFQGRTNSTYGAIAAPGHHLGRDRDHCAFCMVRLVMSSGLRLTRLVSHYLFLFYFVYLFFILFLFLFLFLWFVKITVDCRALKFLWGVTLLHTISQSYTKRDRD